MGVDAGQYWAASSERAAELAPACVTSGPTVLLRPFCKDEKGMANSCSCKGDACGLGAGTGRWWMGYCFLQTSYRPRSR